MYNYKSTFRCHDLVLYKTNKVNKTNKINKVNK